MWRKMTNISKIQVRGYKNSLLKPTCFCNVFIYRTSQIFIVYGMNVMSQSIQYLFGGFRDIFVKFETHGHLYYRPAKKF